jgi:predicted transcriptional regulator
MLKDRHKGRKIQFYLSDDELARFDRQRAAQKTDKEAFLTLLEMAEARARLGNEDSRKSHDRVKTLESEINKLMHDLKDRERKIEELRKEPHSKVEYREVIKEVPKIEYRERIVEKIVEKPIEKIVEKTIVQFVAKIGEEDWLPKYWPFDTEEEYKRCMHA